MHFLKYPLWLIILTGSTGILYRGIRTHHYRTKLKTFGLLCEADILRAEHRNGKMLIDYRFSVAESSRYSGTSEVYPDAWSYLSRADKAPIQYLPDHPEFNTIALGAVPYRGTPVQAFILPALVALLALVHLVMFALGYDISVAEWRYRFTKKAGDAPS